MGKKKRKSTKPVDWRGTLATGLMELLIGLVLLLIGKLIE